MAAQVFYNGLQFMEQCAIGVYTPVLYVGLYVNNVSLVNTNVYGDFVFNSLSGGAPIALTPGTWINASSSPYSEFTYSGLSWLFAPYVGGVTVYGYVVYDYTHSVALWADVFGSGYTVPPAGGGIVLALDKKRQYC